MKKVIIYLIFTTFFYIGCKDEPTKPEELPPGHQQDIPWPSLADSPWPISHGDAQSTGRSIYIGPTNGNIIRKINARYAEYGVCMGNDSVLYFMASGGTLQEPKQGSL